MTEHKRIREDISQPVEKTENRVGGEHRRRARLVYRDQYDRWEAAEEKYGPPPVDVTLNHWRMQLLIMERYLGIFPGDYE